MMRNRERVVRRAAKDEAEGEEAEGEEEARAGGGRRKRQRRGGAGLWRAVPRRWRRQHCTWAALQVRRRMGRTSRKCGAEPRAERRARVEKRLRSNLKRINRRQTGEQASTRRVQ